MIDDKKVPLTANGQTLSMGKLEDVKATQLEILYLIDDIFEDEFDYKYINFLLAIVHAAKIKDYMSINPNIKESFARNLLTDHTTNVLTLLKEGEFEYTDTRKK